MAWKKPFKASRKTGSRWSEDYHVIITVACLVLIIAGIIAFFSLVIPPDTSSASQPAKAQNGILK